MAKKPYAASPCHEILSQPRATRLESLLLEEAAPDRALLEAHVEQCSLCQHTLDQLTSDTLIQRAGTSPAAKATPLLNLQNQQADRTGPTALNGNATASHPDPAPEDAPRLDFLAAATRPEALGRLDHYEVLEVLGKGGFGVVFRAFDESLHRVVAIKVLAPELAATSPARKRFLREARAAAQVRHEHVVQIHAVAEQPLPYLVMEYIPGETLQQRLDRTGPFEATEVVAIGRQMAEGLAAAHAAGLVHRDVKPANVLIAIEPRLQVKITDFGLARAADDATLTHSGVVLGTPLYMSPEQAAGKKLDHRSDLFSLGSVLYAATSGRPPFRAENTLAVLKRVAEDTPRPISEIIPETPEWLCQVICRLMAKNPDRRYQTAVEVAAALEAGPAVLPPRPAPTRRRLAWLTVACGVLAVGVVTLVLGLSSFFGRSNNSEFVQVPGDPKTTDDKTRFVPGAPTPPGGVPSLPVGTGGFWYKRGGDKCRPQFSRDGKRVAAPCGSSVVLFEVATGEALRAVDTDSTDVRGVGFSADGQRLAAFGRNPAKVRVWDLKEDKVLFTTDADTTIDFEPVFSPDGKHLVIAEKEPISRLRVLDALTGKEVKSVPTRHWFSGRFNHAGSRFAATFGRAEGTGPEQGRVTVWDTADWKTVETLEHPPGQLTEFTFGWVQFSPSGKYLAACGRSGITIWNADTLQTVNTVKVVCHEWFDFLADDETLLVWASDGFEPTHSYARYDIGGAHQGSFAVAGPKDYLYVSQDPARAYLWVAPYLTGTRLRIFEPLTGRELLPARNQ